MQVGSLFHDMDGTMYREDMWVLKENAPSSDGRRLLVVERSEYPEVFLHGRVGVAVPDLLRDVVRIDLAD